MEDNENSAKVKIKGMHFLYLGAIVMFCLIITLIIQIMLVTEQVLQAEIKAESVWDRYPQLVSVHTVFSVCRKGGDGYAEKGYFAKEQCQQAAMEKAREEGLEVKANTAFHELDDLTKNIDKPWPLSVVSRLIMRAVSNLQT